MIKDSWYFAVDRVTMVLYTVIFRMFKIVLKEALTVKSYIFV